MTGPGDAAKVSVFVAVDPVDAFDVFTREIDAWWRTGPKYRVSGRTPGRLFLEDRVGGRLFETFERDGGATTIEVGRVTVWDPPARLSLEWRGVNYAPHEKTFVDVAFEASGEGTLVTVRHHGFAALPDDHPARHGATGAELARWVGLWWGSLMTSLREHVGKGRG